MDRTIVAASLIVTMVLATVQAGDCTRFRGPAGDGQFPETGLLKQRAGGQPNPPLYADGLVYVSSGMGSGGAMLSLAESSPTAAAKWTAQIMDCRMQGTVAVDGYIYGTAQSGNKGLICLDWKTGKVAWNAPEVGMGAAIAADGMLYVYTEGGKMYLVKPNSAAFEPVSQFTISEGANEHWAHPTIANGRLYVRHGDVLMVYEIKG